jgi:hypothetical protein
MRSLMVLLGNMFRVSRDFTITSVDYEPEDLASQLPCRGTLIREIPGSDRPDYWLASLAVPLTWKDGDEVRNIKFLVISSRYVGQRVSVPMPSRLTIGIAYVVDETVLEDNRLDFHKCRYVAIGEAAGGAVA